MEEPIYLFRNPHPGGVAGCLSPLPEPLEDAATQLDGRKLTLVQAGEIIVAAIARLGAAQKYHMRLRSERRKTVRFIAIQRGDFEAALNGSGERVDSWKLIEYDLAPETETPREA